MTKRRFDVYAVGNAIMDLQLECSEEELRSLELKKGGMQLLDAEKQHQLLEHFAGRNLHRASGGSAANSVIALAQLGAKPAYACLVADDEFGNHYLSEMADLGVSLHNPPHKNGTTGTCVILITPDAERTMNTHLGVSASFSAQEVSEEYVRDASWLFIEGYLFSSPEGQAAVKKAIAYAKDHGTKIAVTFSDGFIVDAFREPLEHAVQAADLIFANADEAKAFTGESEDKVCFDAFSSHAPYAVMTLRERGALIKSQEGEEFVPSFKVQAIDETGAGDMFAGAFLYGITNGMSMAQSARLACFLASRVVAQLGPRLSVELKGLCEQEGISLA